MAMTQLTVADVGRLKVKDLQHELKKRGLATTGLKAELKQRLEESLQQQEGSDEKMAGDEVASEEPARTAAAVKKSESVDHKPVKEPSPDSEGGKQTSAPVEAETIGTSNERPTDHARSALEEATNEALRGKKRADEGTSDNVQSDDAGQAKGNNHKKQRVEDLDGRSGRKEKPAKRPETKEATASEGDRDDGDRSTSLRIDNFRRPFTLGAVKSLVQELGTFVEDGFWMDAIKTHCYVTYADHDVAAKTMAALDGKVWPPESGIALKAAWSPSTAMEIASGPPRLGQTKGTAAKSREQASLRRHQKPVTIDEFFLKTTTKPVLYYLPLTDEQVEQRKVQQARQASRDANTRRQVQRS